MDDRVVSISAASKAPEMRLKKLEWSDKRTVCKHLKIEVWAREPIIECTDCGAVVDPYQWLRMVMDRWEQVHAPIKYQIKDMKREREELKKAIKILRGEYANERERRAAEQAVMVMPPQKSFRP